MKKISRKLIASILSMAFAVVALGTTTFAWFTSNSTATANLQVNVQAGTDGVLLSTDGRSFSPDVTITPAVGFNFQPVTYDYRSTNDSTKVELKNFKKLSGGALTAIAGDDTRATYTGAGILQFDLYVNTSASGADKGVYFSAEGNTVTTTEASVNFYTLTNGFTFKSDADTTGNQIFSSATKVKVSAANALRSVIEVYSEKETRANVIAAVKAGRSVDYGTAALKTPLFKFTDANTTFANANATATLEDDEKAYNFGDKLGLDNAANSYLKVASKDPFGASNDATAMVDEDNTPALTNGYGAYDDFLLNCHATTADTVTKVTFTLWLEGYDPDCFDAILGQVMKINLSFTTARAQ